MAPALAAPTKCRDATQIINSPCDDYSPQIRSLSRLVLFAIYSSSRRFIKLFPSQKAIGQQGRDWTWCAWWEHGCQMAPAVSHHLQDLHGWVEGNTRERDAGRMTAAGRITAKFYSGGSRWAVIKAWASGPRPPVDVHTRTPIPACTHMSQAVLDITAGSAKMLSHTSWLAREPNKNTHLTSYSLQVDAFKSTSGMAMWTSCSEHILENSSSLLRLLAIL